MTKTSKMYAFTFMLTCSRLLDGQVKTNNVVKWRTVLQTFVHRSYLSLFPTVYENTRVNATYHDRAAVLETACTVLSTTLYCNTQLRLAVYMNVKIWTGVLNLNFKQFRLRTRDFIFCIQNRGGKWYAWQSKNWYYDLEIGRVHWLFLWIHKYKV